MNGEWLQLRDATRRARLSQNAVYRLGAVGKVRTRVGPRGFLEFLVDDLDRVARKSDKGKPRPDEERFGS